MKNIILAILYILIMIRISKTQEGWFVLFSEYNTTTKYTGIQFVNSQTGFMTSSWGNEHNNGGYTLKTTNGGHNWSYVDYGVARYGLFFLNAQTGWQYGGYWDDAGKKSREVFRTTNGGESFVRTYIDSLIDSFHDIFFADLNTGWISSFGNLMKTTNSGVNWSVCSPLVLNSIYFVNANTGWGLTFGGLIYKTTNGGTNWNIQLSVSGNAFTDEAFLNLNTGWVSSSAPNIYKTTNSGLNWTAYSPGITGVISSIEFADSLHGWACGDSGKIIYTSNGGINWFRQATNVYFNLSKLSFANQHTGYAIGIFFSTPYWNDNIMMKTTTGGLTFVQNTGNEIPLEFKLFQNYPNPFNPSTKIKFDVPLDSRLRGNDKVTLKVFDVLGREIAVLVNEMLKAGTYETEWDGTKYPSGVYFYKLITSDYTETRKMVLVK